MHVECNVPTVRLTNPTVKVPSAADTMELEELKPHVTDTGRTLLKVPHLSEALGCKLVDRNTIDKLPTRTASPSARAVSLV